MLPHTHGTFASSPCSQHPDVWSMSHCRLGHGHHENARLQGLQGNSQSSPVTELPGLKLDPSVPNIPNKTPRLPYFERSRPSFSSFHCATRPAQCAGPELRRGSLTSCGSWKNGKRYGSKVGSPIYDWISTKKIHVVIWIVHTMPANGWMAKFDP